MRVPNPGQNTIEVLKRIAGWDEMSDSGKDVAGTRPRLGFEVHGIGELLRARAPFSHNAAQRQAPAGYVPALDAALSADERDHLYRLHALPHLWWEMSYDEFLVARRLRMAQVVRKAWAKLVGDTKVETPKPASIAELIAGGETGAVEFKSTLRTNLHTGQPDEKMHLSALKTIAGFLNAKGGALLIGVSDSGEVLGLDADGFPNEDKMGLHLVNLIKDRIGDVFIPYIHPHFEDQDGERILAIRCERGPKAAFVKDGAQQRFFVRGGNATTELMGASITDYVKQRFLR